MATVPGTLLHHETIPTSVSGARAWRVRYASSDVNGQNTESTGLVIAPIAEGTERFVLTWAHGTTGLGDAACPSLQPDPADKQRCNARMESRIYSWVSNVE